VGGVFAVNVLIAPLDAMLTEITNESIQLVNPTGAISITANIFFSIASTLLLTVVVSLITEKFVEPRLGKYDPSEASAPDESATPVAAVSASAEAKGLRYALYYFLVATGIVALLALIPGAPLRRPIPGEGSSPLLDSIIFIISLLFLAAGVGYGRGASTLKGRNAIIAAATKTISGLGGLLLLFLIISQFIGQFNYTQMPQVLAIGMADLLERANIGAVPLLIGFIIVIMLLDIIIPNSIPKWAIFAPIFVPLFINLGVAPQTVLAAYRIGDSPLNVVTPLMVYLPFTVLVVQRYKRSAGIGSLISLMLPYVLIISVIWIVFFVLWFVFNVPLGPGYPAQL
jgi:aminobenzoyl-glutamate transport protein